MMKLDVENNHCRILRTLIEPLQSSESIDNTELFGEVLSFLEIYIPDKLVSKYKEWKYESIDGIYVNKAVKVGANEIEIIGMCVLISDQSYVPIYALIKLFDSLDQIEWMECKVGQTGENGLVRIKERIKMENLLYTINDVQISWCYNLIYNA